VPASSIEYSRLFGQTTMGYLFEISSEARDTTFQIIYEFSRRCSCPVSASFRADSAIRPIAGSALTLISWSVLATDLVLAGRSRSAVDCPAFLHNP
jgi:hypothetical protein